MRAIRSCALARDGIEGASLTKTVTDGFHPLMEGATLLECSEFTTAVVVPMG
jgi:hypothetical protein